MNQKCCIESTAADSVIESREWRMWIYQIMFSLDEMMSRQRRKFQCMYVHATCIVIIHNENIYLLQISAVSANVAFDSRLSEAALHDRK